ncbi:MAG TPA: hypothetical protein PLS99_09205 [Thermotogota bacterium]|nr:hypothetical protein [Thermotogota bacterium]
MDKKEGVNPNLVLAIIAGVLAIISGVLISYCFKNENKFDQTIFPISSITVFGLALGLFSALPDKAVRWSFTITVLFAGAWALAAITLNVDGTNKELFNIALGFFASGAFFSMLWFCKMILKKPRKAEVDHAN